MAPAALHGLLHWLHHLEGRLTNHLEEMMPPLVTTKFFANLLAMDKFLMASKFTDLGMDLWVLEGYGVMDERWELWHHVVLPWQLSATLKRPLLIEGGDSGDVIMGTTYDLGVYNVKSKIFRVARCPSPVTEHAQGEPSATHFLQQSTTKPNPLCYKKNNLLSIVSLPLLKD